MNRLISSARSNNQGFSLLELLLVLGVIAALAIAAFIVYPSVQAGNQANTESSNINTIRAGIQNLFGSTGRYDTLTTTNANEARLFPTTMNAGVFTGAAITNSWGGAVTLAPALGDAAPAGVADTHFSITYNDITDAACVKLVPAVSSNFDVVDLNGTVMSDPQNLLGGGSVNFDPALVGAECDAGQNVLILTAR